MERCLQVASVAGQVGVSLLEEEVTYASETLDRGMVRRGAKGQALLLREDTGWRKPIAHRTFWHVETGWAHFGENAWRLGSEGDTFFIFRCFALFFFQPSICTLKNKNKNRTNQAAS